MIGGVLGGITVYVLAFILYGQMAVRYPKAWGNVAANRTVELVEPIFDISLAYYFYICIMSYAEDYDLTIAAARAAGGQPMLTGAQVVYSSQPNNVNGNPQIYQQQPMTYVQPSAQYQQPQVGVQQTG